MPGEPAGVLATQVAEGSGAGARARIVRGYYGFQIFFALLFWVPIFYDYQRRIGLDDGAIFQIQSLYYFVFCVLEIPTGYFADRWGRLTSMRAGAWTLVLSNVLPFAWPSWGGMLAHFVLLALARSFVSGASSAYVYAELEALGDKDAFKVIEGRARAWGLVAKVVCWAVVGPMFEAGIAWPYVATVGAALLSAVFAHTLPAATVSARSASLALGPAFRALGARPMLLLVMLQGVSVFVLGRIVQVNLFQPMLEQRGVPVASHGAVMAGMAMFEALGAGFPQHVRKLLSDVSAVFVLTVLTGAALALVSVSGAAPAVAGLMAFAWLGGLSFPIQRQLFNDTVPDERYRATLMSMESIVDRAASAAVAAILGGWVASGRTDAFLQLSAAATIAMMLVLWLAMRTRRAAA